MLLILALAPSGSASCSNEGGLTVSGDPQGGEEPAESAGGAANGDAGGGAGGSLAGGGGSDQGGSSSTAGGLTGEPSQGGSEGIAGKLTQGGSAAQEDGEGNDGGAGGTANQGGMATGAASPGEVYGPFDDGPAHEPETDPASWETSCNGYLVHNHGIPPDYPSTVVESDNVEDFAAEWQRFLDTYGVSDGVFTAQPNAYGVITGFERVGQTDWPFIDESITDPSVMASLCEDFIQEWDVLLGARDAILVPLREPRLAPEATGNGISWVYRLEQDYCGIPFRNASTPWLELRWSDEPRGLVGITAALRPMVPVFANTNFTKDEIRELFVGQTVRCNDSDVGVVIEDDWSFEVHEPTLDIRSLASQGIEGTTGLTFRTVVRVQGRLPTGEVRAEIAFDIIDGTVVELFDERYCFVGY